LATIRLAAPTSASIQVATPTIVSGPDLGCQIAKSGDYVHVQALNKGSEVLPAGTLCRFTIVGPTKKTTETKTLKADLAAGRAVNMTSAIKVSSVIICTPAG
jgi:hypothetical protein